MKRIVHILILVFIMVALALPCVPIYATVAAPDSMALEQIFINRSLISPNDMLIYFRYGIVYGSNPTPSADQTFIFRLFDTDGSTELGSITPYPYHDSGYGYGFGALYFAPDDAPTWGQAYTLGIYGNPVQFGATVPSYPIQLSTSNYSAFTAQTDNRNQATTNIIAILHSLDVIWTTSIVYGTNLLESGISNDVLASAGQTYMSGALVGGQSMLPDLFPTSISLPQYDSENWTTNQADIYANRYGNYTWVGNTTAGVGGLFGGSSNLGGGLIVAGFAIFCVIYGASKMQSVLSGMMAGVLVIICGYLVGFLPAAYMGTIIFFIAGYGGLVLYFNRSS